MGSVAQSKNWSLGHIVLFSLGIMGASVQVVTLQLWEPSRELIGLIMAGIARHSRYILICPSISSADSGSECLAEAIDTTLYD
jgi:predicted branched-subunit amino acid permease